MDERVHGSAAGIQLPAGRTPWMMCPMKQVLPSVNLSAWIKRTSFLVEHENDPRVENPQPSQRKRQKIMGEDPQSLENHGFPQISQLVLHSRSSVHNQPESWMWTLDFFAYICVSLISGYSTSLAHDPVAPAFSRNPQQPQLHIFAAIAENRHTADEEGQAHPPSPVTKLNSWRMYIDESNWDRAAHR